jgi:ribosome biogenesis GTPase
MENNNKKIARVVCEYKGAYKVKVDSLEGGEFLARITGKQMFEALSREDYPAVGDWVVIEELPQHQAVIKEILHRKTIMKRKSIRENDVQIIATNIDVAFAVESVGRDFNLNRFERYFSIAREGKIKPAIILNKIDLVSEEELKDKLQQIKNRFPDIDVIATSILNGSGLDELKRYIEQGKTYCFLGSSGVGKSSLINKLLGKDIIKTEDISIYSERGKHVTTARQMYFLDGPQTNGAVVIDNPGMREVGMADVGKGIDEMFEEISALSMQCKYKDCTHTHESGCKVLAGVKSGEIDKGKYQNYLNLKKEAKYYEMSDFERREKNRKFGKFLNKAKKSFKKSNYKDF